MWIIAAIIGLVTLAFFVGVWVASETERRAFLRTLRHFDDVTTPVLTPKIRISAYKSLIEKTRQQTLRIISPFQGVPKDKEREALRRRHCVLRFRSIATGDDPMITQKIKR